MEDHNTSENISGPYYLIGLIFGALTALVISGSVLWTIAGAVIGLIITAMYRGFAFKSNGA